MATEVIRYEDAAEVRTVTGWACKVCGRFHQGATKAAEHAARYCHGSADMPCRTEGCAGRVSHGHMYCAGCDARREAERWESLPKVDWDGETPLCTYRGDRYFFDADAVAEYIADRMADGVALEDVRLVLCEPDRGRDFDIEEYLADSLPDDDHGGSPFSAADTAEINKAVNDWIEKRAPFSWSGNDHKPVNAASLPVPDPDDR